MKNFRMVKRVMATTIAAAILGFGSLASATVVKGTSDAYDVSIGLSALGLNVGIGPVFEANPTHQTAPDSYDKEAGISALGRVEAHIVKPLVSVGAGLRTGLLSAHAKSDADGNPGEKSAEGEQIINDLKVGLRSRVGIIESSVLGVNAETITSNALVSGDYGAWNHLGSSYIENLNISVLGQSILGDLIALGLHVETDGKIYAAPNTKFTVNVLGLANVDLTLNEQIWSDITDFEKRSLEVNAIHLKLNNSSLLGSLLNSDIIIGHSDAALWGEANPAPVPTPEPSTFVLSGFGLAGLFLMRRRAVKA